MTFDNNLSQDVSLQQGEFLELWDSSRFTQRQYSLGRGHAENHQDSQLAEERNCEDMDLPRNHQLGAALPKNEDERKDRPMNSENEDSHLLESDDPSSARACGPPTWLSSALLRQQSQSLDDTENGHGNGEKWCPVCSASGSQPCICSTPLHAGTSNATSFLNQSTYSHWLSMQGTGIHASQNRPGEFANCKDDEFGVDRQQNRISAELDLAAAHGRDPQRFLDLHPSTTSLRYAGDYDRADWDRAKRNAEWEDARKRCMVVNHPLYVELLGNHAACLRVGTPVDQIPNIEAQLSRAPITIDKYRLQHDRLVDITQDEQVDLDRCMYLDVCHQIEVLLSSKEVTLKRSEFYKIVQTDYNMILATFKEVLQHHVFTDVTEAMMSCWELEQALHTLTGATPEEGHGATMSDDDEEYDHDYGAYDHNMDYHDNGGYGPLVPTESERTLMERVRLELKHELKQGYKSKIEDVREEILRKRRAGKLPEGTTTVLKAWWLAHSKWPYPTEDEKELLIQETGLELKQVNNWFINQRKRNWHNNPMLSSQADSKIKVRKSW